MLFENGVNGEWGGTHCGLQFAFFYDPCKLAFVAAQAVLSAPPRLCLGGDCNSKLGALECLTGRDTDGLFPRPPTISAVHACQGGGDVVSMRAAVNFEKLFPQHSNQSPV